MKQNKAERKKDEKKYVRLAIINLCESNDLVAAIDRLVSDGITQRDAKRYATEAAESIARAADVDRRAEVGLYIKRTDKLYDTAIKANDYKVALKAINLRAKILNLLNTKELDQSDEKLLDEMGVQEAREHLERLEICQPDLPIDELARLVAQQYLMIASKMQKEEK